MFRTLYKRIIYIQLRTFGHRVGAIVIYKFSKSCTSPNKARKAICYLAINNIIASVKETHRWYKYKHMKLGYPLDKSIEQTVY